MEFAKKILEFKNYKEYDKVIFCLQDDDIVEVMHDGKVVEILSHRETFNIIHDEVMRFSEFTDRLEPLGRSCLNYCESTPAEFR